MSANTSESEDEPKGEDGGQTDPEPERKRAADRFGEEAEEEEADYDFQQANRTDAVVTAVLASGVNTPTPAIPNINQESSEPTKSQHPSAESAITPASMTSKESAQAKNAL